MFVNTISVTRYIDIVHVIISLTTTYFSLYVSTDMHICFVAILFS